MVFFLSSPPARRRKFHDSGIKQDGEKRSFLLQTLYSSFTQTEVEDAWAFQEGSADLLHNLKFLQANLSCTGMTIDFQAFNHTRI